MSAAPWTRVEDTVIVRRYPLGGVAGVQDELPHRTRSAIRWRVRVLGVRPNYQARRGIEPQQPPKPRGPTHTTAALRRRRPQVRPDDWHPSGVQRFVSRDDLRARANAGNAPAPLYEGAAEPAAVSFDDERSRAPLWNVRDAAEYLGITRHGVEEAVRKGRLNVCYVLLSGYAVPGRGRRRLQFTRAELDRYKAEVQARP